MQQKRAYMPAASAGAAYTGQITQQGRDADWSSEIKISSPQGRSLQRVWGDSTAADRQMSAMPQEQTLQMHNGLSDDAVEAPVTEEEVYAGSTKAMLRRNLGNYVVATFLIGTQNTVSWEGVLYDVGNDYVTIYQPGRDRYIVNDIYSLKYTEFYDVRRRELCDRLMREQGWDVGETWPPAR